MRTRSHVLTDELSLHLRERILSGEYEPGASITETGVAAEYGVARPTARSALDRLVFDGLLIRHAHAALRVREVASGELPEILSLLEFFEERALDAVLAGSADLRDMRDRADESLHKYLHTLVEASGSERLIQFHRQTTFALLLGIRRVGGSAGDERREVPRTTMNELTDLLFRLDRDHALAELRTLWAHRAAGTMVAALQN